MEYIPYGKQHINKEDIDAVVNVLKSDWLTQGPRVSEFEDVVSNYHGCKYAVAFCNGTAALHASYYVSTKFRFGKAEKEIEDINNFISFRQPSKKEYNKFKEQYWEFISSPMTFVASANAGLYCGGTPKFVDINPRSYCMDIEKIEDQITEYTRVITPVSYAGYPVDVKAIKSLQKVKDNNICIIHDACHAIGASLNGNGIADFADMTVLSFHPVKHITTGEGGMVLTNREDCYNKLMLFRNHGITKDKDSFIEETEGDWYYEMQELGFNYRITDIQCALGITQMSKLNNFLYKRNIVANIYEKELENIDWIELQARFNKDWLKKADFNNLKTKPENLHSYHLFPIRLDKREDRKKFFNYMKSNEIGVQVHYIPVNQQYYYANKNISYESTGNANRMYESQISLPIYFDLQEKQIDYILEKIKMWRK